MEKKLFLVLVMLVGIHCFAQTPVVRKNRNDAKVNYGIKGGFNSSMYFIEEFKIDNVTINELQNNYKVGYFGAMFLRINMKKHFIQPELSYNISKGEIVFDKKGSQHPDIEPDYANIVSTIRTVEMPVLYGYNFIKSGPYGMCVFVGPKVKYVWDKESKLEFNNFDQQGIAETLHPINVNWVVGIGVNISKVFFDFRYEIGMHNISKGVTYDSLQPGSPSNIVFNRYSNILSFSLGIML